MIVMVLATQKNSLRDPETSSWHGSELQIRPFYEAILK